MMRRQDASKSILSSSNAKLIAVVLLVGLLALLRHMFVLTSDNALLRHRIENYERECFDASSSSSSSSSADAVDGVSRAASSKLALKHGGTTLGDACKRLLTENARYPPIVAAFCDYHSIVYEGGGSLAYADDRGDVDTDTYAVGQMALSQYLYIALTILSTSANPSSTPASTSATVRVLVYSCGHDSRTYFDLVRSVGGEVFFLEDHKGWLDVCAETLPEGNEDAFIHISYAGSIESHEASIRANDGRPDADVELLALPSRITDVPFDVIVVDAPAAWQAGEFGRSMSLYTALRLAEDAPSSHVTDIFLHDANRKHEQFIAKTIMADYELVSVTFPPKALLHWRVRGKQ